MIQHSQIIFAAIYVWLVLGMTLDPLVPFMAPILGLPLQPGMDQPYLSRSITEFWGRRSEGNVALGWHPNECVHA